MYWTCVRQGNWDGRHSPIQLAAISNYKLAQLTFAPPDLHSLRKTAVIKNTAQYIYDITPKEWLDEMTRWEFFTLEALDDIDMTQEGLETILSEYVHIMDSFKAINTQMNVDMEPIDMDDDNNKVASQEYETRTPDRLSNIPPPIASLATSPPTRQDVVEQRRKSFRLNQHRISWTSDTGLPSFAASQHLAGELMSLFDMEFKVDISLDPYSTPPPQLPELSYIKDKQNHRSSVDSFMCLIPAFESFQIDSHDGLSYVSKANKRTSSLLGPSSSSSSNKRISSSLAPARSSSLKYKVRQQPIHRPSPDLVKLTPSPTDDDDDVQEDKRLLTKKKSIRKLVSLFGKKRLNSETAIPLDHRQLTAMPLASISSPSFSATTPTTTYSAITPSTLGNQQDTPSHHQQQPRLVRSDSIKPHSHQRTPDLYPSSASTTGADKQSIPQSISSHELGRLQRNQSLSYSSFTHQQQNNQSPMNQRLDTRQYHSTYDLSQMYTNRSNSSNGSKDPVTMSPTSPVSPRKSTSSFLQRMTTFARRKKQVNNTSNPLSPVPV
ncbi:hypothetical protein BC941DRAFT_451904 [Chlamydoabsidia padenii]|nr:hypothetical protein BC941DRAFT_451904 [Chlamydoabsidia padenii]